MADKKITELPYIDTLSGSLVGTNTPLQNTVIPLVLRGNTNQINIENFSKFVTAYSATTGSNRFIGNQTITGSLIVTGDVKAERYYIETITSSVIYESGSTVFGNSGDDTHTFTGSMLTTGSIILNGSAIGTGQLNVQTASQDLVNRGISSVTGSINTTTSSFNSVFLQISSTTGSINTQSSSQDLVNRQISSTTGSINTTTSSFDSVFLRISSTTGSINTTTSSFDSVFLRISSTTGSINTTTSSFDSVFLGISSTTGSINTQSSSQDLVNRQISSTTGSINTTTSSFDSVFLRISSTTGSINTTTSSFDSVFLRISSTTGSINTTTSSFDLVFRGISSVTGAINTQSSSQDLVNFRNSTFTSSLNFTTASLNSFTGSVIGQTNTISTFTSSVNFATQSLNTQTGSQGNLNAQIGIATASLNFTTASLNTQTGSQQSLNTTLSIVTGSLIGITNGLMAFTAALDNTYATDAQLYQLYQATASIQFATASLNTQTGSQNSINFNISVVTSSIDAHILKQATQTGSQDLVNLGISSVTGSLIGITNGLMAFTAALDSTYATDAQLYQLYQSTASIQFATASLNTQTGSQNTINFNISVVTSSIDSHILKQATQTGSQDLVNLGISTFTGSLRNEINGIEAYTASLKGAIEVSGQNVNVLGMITAQQFNVTYVSSSIMYQSGSTEFGDTSDDRHLFTGSLIVSGTLNVGTDETGHGRISFHEPTNTLRIQSSKNGTDSTPISFWAQDSGGGFAQRVVISGSNMQVRSAGKLEVFRSDNARSGSFYTDNLATIVEASTDPIRLSSPERAEIYVAGTERARFTSAGIQIGTSTTDTSLGSNTRLKVVGDGSVNAGASQGSLFIAAGNQGGDTGLPINMGTGGGTMMLLASINTSTGTSTNSATYIVRFYFDGNNAPTTTYLGGSSDFVTFGVTPSNTLAVSGSSSGNKSYAWFINKFGA